ncbi:hypothetical protein ABFX02_04G093100 [Erythranthe guttata]
MKFFNWMQKKFNAGGQNGHDHQITCKKKLIEPSEQEFDGLMLSIGTFGNKHDIVDQSSSSPNNFSEFTAEEIVKLEKELTKLLTRKSDKNDHLPLDRFLNSPSSLLATSDTSFSTSFSDDKEDEEEDDDEIDRTVRIILKRCKELSRNKKSIIGKKSSLSFLVKKMFVCTGGFAAAAPRFRDAFQESRMEKLLRTMLTRTIFPRNTSGASSTKKFIEERRRNEDESHDQIGDGSSKWIKTDSECELLLIKKN